MNSAPADVAARLCQALELGDDVATAMTVFPTKGWDQAIPKTL